MENNIQNAPEQASEANQTTETAPIVDKGQLASLEKDIKTAFKSGNHEEVKTLAEKIKTVDAENHLANKLIEKTERIQQKEAMKAKEVKIKEYEAMLDKLFKEKNSENLIKLAKEFKEFAPENRLADKWLNKAEELNEKLGVQKDADKLTDVQKESVTPTLSQPVSPQVMSSAESPGILKSKMQSAEESSSKAPKGNLFTKMFGQKKDEEKNKSIIDTIVAKTEGDPRGLATKGKSGDGRKFLAFSKVFMNVTAVFIAFSFLFLSMEMDLENKYLSLVGIENTGIKLHNAAEEKGRLEAQEAELIKEINDYKEGYNDKHLNTVNSIIDNRVDWKDVFEKVNGTIDSVYNLNEFFGYVEVTNYTYDRESNAIRINGVVRDPTQRNLTALLKLERAFKTYPADDSNPDDLVEPYFKNFRELTSLSKTPDENGRFESTFQFSFELNE